MPKIRKIIFIIFVITALIAMLMFNLDAIKGKQKEPVRSKENNGYGRCVYV